MKLLRPGLLPYGQALALQLELRERLQTRRGHDGESTGYLVCLEHPPTITLGKRGRASDLVSPQWIREQAIELFKIDRGGEATYHGPGQLVIYPILRLDELGLGVVDLIRGLADSLAKTLSSYGVTAVYDREHPGLWTTMEEPHRKIASVGMRVAGGVTTHGAAINLVNDMRPFSMFVPCGMPGAPMVRLLDCVGDVNVDAFTAEFLDHFAAHFGVELEPFEVELPAEDSWVSPISLEELLALDSAD